MNIENLTEDSRKTFKAICDKHGLTGSEVLSHFNSLSCGRKVSKHSKVNNPAWGVFSNPVSV